MISLSIPTFISTFVNHILYTNNIQLLVYIYICILYIYIYICNYIFTSHQQILIDQVVIYNDSYYMISQFFSLYTGHLWCIYIYIYIFSITGIYHIIYDIHWNPKFFICGIPLFINYLMNYLRSPIETDKYNNSLHRSVGKLDNDNFQHYKLQPLDTTIRIRYHYFNLDFLGLSLYYHHSNHI